MLRAAAILMTSRVRRRPRDEDGDYEVGYGKPPRYTRFKKGRSGKPERPTGGAKNLSTLLTEALKSASSSPSIPHVPWLSAVTITPAASIEPIAELGIVLLLFMSGLELSFERLWVMRRLVFGLGSLQVVLCAAVLAGVAMFFGQNRISAGVIGLAVAMSSTAVVIQVLSDEKRLNTATGRTSFAILLFQDLAVVPILLVLGTFAPTTHVSSLAAFGVAVGQACWQSPRSSL